MTIAQVECFLEAAKQGSFSKAATELYISQQALSRQVQSLEKELGIRLFQRFNKGIQMSEEGKLFFDVWEEMLEKHNKVVEYVKKLRAEQQRNIRFGIADMGEFLTEISKGILAFNKAHTKLNMEYEVSATREMIRKLENDELNMLITYRSELEQHSDLKCMTLNQDPLKIGIYVSKKNPLAARRNLQVKHIKGQTLGYMGKAFSNDHKERLDMVTTKADIHDSVEWKEYSSRQSLGLAVITEKCITIVFKRLLEGFDDSLVFYPLEEYTDMYDIVVAWKEDKYTPIVNAFLQGFRI